jgi:hypothetical protein
MVANNQYDEPWLSHKHLHPMPMHALVLPCPIVPFSECVMAHVHLDGSTVTYMNRSAHMASRGNYRRDIYSRAALSMIVILNWHHTNKDAQ